MYTQWNVSNSSRDIQNIDITRSLEKEEDWHPKNDNTHSILLSHYAHHCYVFMPMECKGRKNQEIKGILPDPLLLSGSQKRGGSGYARLAQVKVGLPNVGETSTSQGGTAKCQLISHLLYM